MQTLDGEMNTYSQAQPFPQPLGIAEIAAWQLRHLVPHHVPAPEWVGALPSLQRDAVWKPGQVELLWDSLFRGFPIGSLVLSDKLATQGMRFGKVAGKADPWPDVAKKRHLLDGQQRCNAIALGFADPFRAGGEAEKEKASILWIDLFPEPRLFLSGSTRHFLFRVTTAAHPWGFDTWDVAGRLSAEEMRASLDQNGCKTQPGERRRRPSAVELCPLKSSVPIPAAWLLLEARQKSGAKLWTAICDRCAKASMPWAKKAAEALAAPADARLDEIERGAHRAWNTRIALLEVPSEAIHAASRSESSAPVEEENISNVEHLFQRLNNGGSAITADDLRYSMIKAYWPGIEHTIEANPQLVHPSRLAVLGARAALATTEQLPDALPGDLIVTALRSLATDPKKVDQQELVKRFFGVGETPSAMALPEVSRAIEQWLLFRQGDEIGLPPALRVAIAQQSPEVYLFLMILAHRMLVQGDDLPAMRQTVLGLTTALHWFAGDKGRAVRRAYERLTSAEKITPQIFAGILAHQESGEDEPTGVFLLPDPRTMDEIIPPPDLQNLEEHEWYRAIVDLGVKPGSDAGNSNEEKARRERLMLPFVWCLVGNKELLIHAQRKWMQLCFADFDPADVAMWEEHNRPWDLDHLAPQSSFSNLRNARFLKVCQRWGHSIGNLHILPFEENRSRGAQALREAFSDPERLSFMLLEGDDLEAFSLGREHVYGDVDAVLRFARATHRRIGRIYADWYSSLGIAALVTPATP